MNFLFNFVFEKIVVAIISRKNRKATNWVSRPRMSAMAPKNSRRLKRTAKVAPPGHPVPFTKPIVFWRSFIFGHPWARKMAPRASRPTSKARSGRVRRAIEYRHPLSPAVEEAFRSQRTALRSKRPVEELGDVVPADVLSILRLRGVVQHDETIRTRGRDRIRMRLLDVAQTAVVHFLPAFLHPHAGASRPAAEPAVAGLLHLDDPHARDPIQDLPGFIEDLVVPSQVACIVVGEELEHVLRRREPTRVDQFAKELGVVDDVVSPAEIRIFVLQRVEAVRTSRDDSRDRVAVQRLDVPHDHRLRQIFVAESPRWIAGALLLRSEDGKPHAGLPKDPREGLGDLPVPIVERRGAADPVQDLDALRRGRVRHHRDAEALRPSRALVPADAPRVEVLLDVPHRLSCLWRHLAFGEDHVPTHLEDLRDVLVHHGALVHAGVAGRTRPDSLLGVDRLEHVWEAFDLPSEDGGALRVQCVPHVRDDSHRVKRFPRRVRRACVRATSAFRARVAVEELPPRELFDAVHAERLRLLEVGLLDRAARCEIHEERVHDREDDVHVFRVRHVREEREQEDDVGPPEKVPPGRVCGDDRESHQRRRDRLPRRESGASERDVGRVVEEERGDDAQDEQEHDRRVEHALVHELLRADDVPSIEGHTDPDGAEDGDDLLGQVQRSVQGKPRDRGRGHLPSAGVGLGRDLDDARSEDHERPKDERMEDPGVPFPRDLALEDPVHDEVLQPGRDVVPSPLLSLREEQVPDSEVQLPAENRQRDDDEEGRGIRVEGAQHHAHSWESALPSSTRGSRFLEGQHDSFRVLFPDAARHLRDLRFGIDFVICLRWHLPNFGVRGDDHQDNLGRVLIEESGQPFDRGSGYDAHRFDEEQDGSATGDDRGRVLRRGAGRVPNAEPEGPVFVRESLADHLGAHRRLELGPELMLRALGHRGAPWIASTTAWAKTDVLTSFDPGICRARSYVTTFDATTLRTASRNRTAASCHPRYSSIITPASISAVGFTLSMPAYFGALPWTGSNTAWASPMFPPAATPSPPIWAAAASLR